MAREFETLSAEHVGKTRLHLFGRVWPVSGFIGKVLPGDVGKRVYLVSGILQVENDEQRAERWASEDRPQWASGYLVCPKCKGMGYGPIPECVPCEVCEGSGEIPEVPNA